MLFSFIGYLLNFLLPKKTKSEKKSQSTPYTKTTYKDEQLDEKQNSKNENETTKTLNPEYKKNNSC